MRKLVFNPVFVMFITISMCLPAFLHAQLVVSDPTLAGFAAANKATTVKQLQEAAAQTVQLSKTYEQLKKANELYTKVSNTLRNVEMVQTLLGKQVDLVVNAGQALKGATKQKAVSAKSLNQLKQNINMVVESNRQNVNMIKELLSEGTYKMSDGDRIKLIMDIEKKTDEAQKKINRYRSAYETSNGMMNFVKKQGI